MSASKQQKSEVSKSSKMRIRAFPVNLNRLTNINVFNF